MKVIMTVHGWNNEKEFRQDLDLGSISSDEYEQIKEDRMVYQSMTINEASGIKPTPNFVRIWKWYLPENKEEQKYFMSLKIDQ